MVPVGLILTTHYFELTIAESGPLDQLASMGCCGMDGTKRIVNHPTERGNLIRFSQNRKFGIVVEYFGLPGREDDRDMRIALDEHSREREPVGLAGQYHVAEDEMDFLSGCENVQRRGCRIDFGGSIAELFEQ